MASLQQYRHAVNHVCFQVRNLSRSSRLGKKQYDYDLDSLVKWKQDTKLLFGPQRKPTKLGKLKKRKKELDKECLENIETLSSLSNKDVACESIDVAGDSQKALSESRNQDCDINQLVSNHQKTSSEEQISRSKGTKKSDGKGVTKKNLSKLSSSEHLNSRSIDSALASSRSKETSVSYEIYGREDSTTCAKPKRAHSIDDQHVLSTNTQTDEIDIPKIEPVPLNKDNVPSAKHTMPKMAYLPMEAPISFDVITNFPLILQNVSEDTDKQKLQSFKMDVEKMALRVLPSVKTVLNKTMSDLNRFFLNRWRESMINELGEIGFQKYKNETMRQGTNLHANIMEYLSGKEEKELQIMPENEGHWASVHSALQSVSDIRALEMDVLHPDLLYRGVFDCVARYKDLLCIIDWKVSKKPRPLLKNTYDDPLQVAAYIGAVNASSHYVKQHGVINHGLIVVAYPDGSPAHMHMMSKAQVEQYWHEWTARLHSFYTLMYTEKVAHKNSS